MKNIEIFTDGACKYNPGPGGWGTILRYKGKEKELCGFCPDTTNNRMEITAIIKGLEALKEPCKVKLYTDSGYVCDSFNKGWLKKWEAKGWKRTANKPVINLDLWLELLKLTKIHDVEFIWVKGHAGHIENERCDRLAVNAIKDHI